MSLDVDAIYSIVNRILRNAEEIIDLIDRLEVELLRPELERRLREEEVSIESVRDLKKLVEEDY